MGDDLPYVRHNDVVIVKAPERIHVTALPNGSWHETLNEKGGYKYYLSEGKQ